MAELSLVHDSFQAPDITAPWSLRVSRHGYQRLLTFSAHIDIHYFWEKRWFFIAMAVGAALLYAPQPDELNVRRIDQGLNSGGLQVRVAFNIMGRLPVSVLNAR